LKFLRELGAMAEVVEKRIPRVHITKDLYGFIDILAVDDLPGTLGVQTTTGEHQAARIAKIQSKELEKNVRKWLAAGNRISVHGWSKQGPRGQRKRWHVNITPITEA
jgi:hypothetical protein